MAKTTTNAKPNRERSTTEKTAAVTRKKAATAKKSSSRSAKKRSDRSGADWDAAKDILAAHRTLARAEKREADLADGLKTHRRTLKALDQQSAALAESLARASDDLQTATSTRRKVAKKLRKLESARPNKKS